MPALPEDLKVVNTNVSKISDFYSKAIVSGSSYGVEQAFTDASICCIIPEVHSLTVVGESA